MSAPLLKSEEGHSAALEPLGSGTLEPDLEAGASTARVSSDSLTEAPRNSSHHSFNISDCDEASENSAQNLAHPLPSAPCRILHALGRFLYQAFEFLYCGEIVVFVLVLAAVVVVALALPLAILCCPCICYLVIAHLREGRIVILDGTQPPTLDENTRQVIEQAKASDFHARVGTFASLDPVGSVANFGRRLSQTFPRTGVTGTASFTAEGARSEQLAGTNGQTGPVEELRERLVEARRSAMMAKAKEDKSQQLPFYLQINVEREHIVEQSLQCLGAVPCTQLLATHLGISFEGEMGVDAGGVRRDWFDSLGRNLVSSAERGDGHLMVLPDETLAPRPFDDRFTDFYAIGRLAALAVWFGIPLPISLGSNACKLFMDEPIGPVDLQRLDPEFYQFRVKPILRSGGVDELEAALGEPVMFVSAATEERASKELCPGGDEKKVTEDNKHEYIKLLCEHFICGDRREQFNVLLQGFWDIFPKDLLSSSGLTYRELALLISGYSTLDPNDWRSHTDVSDVLQRDSAVIQWFWQMVAEMSNEERATLLHFATGSSRVSALGFAGVSPKFNISVQGDDVEHLPHAHTCGNQLVLPRYSSKEMLVEKMRIALANDEGFGFM